MALDTGDLINAAFTPTQGATVNLACSAVSANVQITTGTPHREIRIFNSGSVAVFVRCGSDNAVAATIGAEMPIAPGTIEVLSLPFAWIAGITASGTATIYVTPGEGI